MSNDDISFILASGKLFVLTQRHDIKDVSIEKHMLCLKGKDTIKVSLPPDIYRHIQTYRQFCLVVCQKTPHGVSPLSETDVTDITFS